MSLRARAMRCVAGGLLLLPLLYVHSPSFAADPAWSGGPDPPAPPSSAAQAAWLARPSPAPSPRAPGALAPTADDPPLLPPPRRIDPQAEPPDGERAVLLGAARNAVRQHNWDQAVARFQEYFRRYGDDFDVRKEFAGVLVQAGRLREALAEYKRLAVQKPDDRDLLVALADAAVQAREYATGIAALVRALTLAPEDRDAAVKLARAYVFADQFAYALRVYDQYLAGVRPEDERAPRGLAALLIDMGRPGDAVPFLTARLDLQPADAEALAGLLRAYAALGQQARAEDALQLLQERAPRALAVRQELGDSLYSAGAFDLAGMVYGQILHIEPSNGFAILGQARVQMKLFRPEPALGLLDRVPTEPAYERSAALGRAEYHQLVGQYLEAKQIYEAFLRRNAQDHEVRLSLAQLLEFIREDEKAKAEYLKIAPSAPQSRTARVGIASTLTTQRHFPDALEQCKRLLAEKPDDGAAMGQFVRTLGKCGQTPEAVAQARAFLTDYSRNPPACLTVRLALAKVLRDARRFQEAAHESEGLLFQPGGRIPEAYYGLARSLEGMGDPEKAHHVLDEIAELPGPNERNRLMLADLFSGDFDDVPAVEMAQAVLKFDPNNLAALIRLADAQGRLDRQTGKVADAVATAKAVLALSPSNVRGRLALARALATAQSYAASASAYEPLIAADPEFLVPRRERARVLYSAHQYDSGAAAYADMIAPCADERLHADLAALAERDPRVGAVLGPCLGCSAPGDVLIAQASKAAGALGDAECQAALQRLLLDYQARRTEQEGSRLEGQVKDDFWRHYEVIPIAKSLIQLEPSNTSALFDLGQDFSTLRLTRNAIEQYAQDTAIDPSEYEAQTAMERAGFELGPRAIAGVDYFQEHGFDGLARIERTYYRSQVQVPFGDEDQFFSLGFTRVNYVPKDDRTLVGNIVSVGLQDKFECDGRLQANGVLNFEQYPNRIHDRPTFDAGVSYVFCDEVTGRAGAFLQNVVENGESMREDIFRYGARFGADVQPARDWWFGGTGTIYGYSDNNEALELVLNNDVVLLPPPCQLKVVLTADFLGYREQTVRPGPPSDFLYGTIHPYFAPSFYGYYEGRLEWKHWISRDYFAHSNQCWYSLQGGLGWDNRFNNYETVRALWNFDVRPWLSLSGEGEVILSPVYQEAQALAYVTVRW